MLAIEKERRKFLFLQVCGPTIQTSVKFRDFEKLYLRQFLAKHF